MSKYRCLFIESGDYLYKQREGSYLFSIYEVAKSSRGSANFIIFEGSKDKIIHKLNSGIPIRNSIDENVYYEGNEQLFEFIEVPDEEY